MTSKGDYHMTTTTENVRDYEQGRWRDESAPPPAPHTNASPPVRYYVPPPLDTTRCSDADRGFDWNRVAYILLAVLLPPLGVFFQTGCDKNFAINVLLTLLGYIPGIIHALYVILTA